MGVESRVQTAKRLLDAQKALVTKQRALIDALNRAYQSTEIADEMLKTMERTLVLLEQNYQRLSESSEAHRDAEQ